MMTAIREESIDTLPLAPLQETDTIRGDIKMNTNAVGRGHEIDTIIDTVMTVVIIEEGVIQETIIEGAGETRSEESRREEGSSRSTGTRAVCTAGRTMITMSIRRNYSNKQKD